MNPKARRYLFGIVGLSLLCAPGCSPQSDYFPSSEGRTWKYLVNALGQSRTVTATCTGQTRVGQAGGFAVECDGVTSRFSWRGGELVASEMCGALFDPPVTILSPSTENQNWTNAAKWTVRGTASGVQLSAFQEPAKLTMMGNERETLKVVLLMKSTSHEIELTSWYQRGVGIIRQEQRQSGVLLTSLEWIGGS